MFTKLRDLFRRKYHLTYPLDRFERKLTSQFGEDGIIEHIFECIPPRSRYFVEFGIGPAYGTTHEQGLEGNCVQLKQLGWRGLFMDSEKQPDEFSVKQEFVRPSTINSLLQNHGVPDNVDIISIDVDGQDWWILKELNLSPTLLVIEYNGHHPRDIAVTVPLDPDFRWDGTDYYGASLLAMNKVAKSKGYTLVFANGVNAFFVRRDRLANPGDFAYELLYKPAANHPRDPQDRPFLSV